MRIKRILWVATALAVLGVPAWTLGSAAQGGPTTSTGRPLSPAVAFSEVANSHLMVWAEDLGTGTGLDLFALRLSETGLPTGRVLPVIVAPGNQSDPALVFSRTVNEYLLVYTDDASSTGAAPTATAPIGPPVPGTPQPTAPPLPTPNPLVLPDLPVLPELPVAPERHAVPLDTAITGAANADLTMADALSVARERMDEGTRLVGPGGSVALDGTGQPDGVDTDPMPLELLDDGRIQQQPTATIPPPSTPAPGGPGGPPGGPVSGSRDILGVWLSNYGQVVSNHFALVSAPSDDTYPDVDYLATRSSDQYSLVWREVVGSDVTLSTMRMRGLGRYFVLDQKRTIVTGVDIGRPSVAADWSRGGYLVVWAETPRDQADRDIFGKRLNLNAFPYKPIFRVVGGNADQVYPSVASLGFTGGYLLAWEQRNAADPPDIKTRQLNSNGYPWRPQYELAGGPRFSFSPDLAPTRVGRDTLLVWLDRTSAGDHQIVTAEVSITGRRLGPERVLLVGGGASGVTPVAPPPNPGNPTPPPVPTP